MTDDPSAYDGLVGGARRIGHHLWVERRLFAWLGAWSSVPLAPPVTVFLGEQSSRHGWHADVLFDRLPELRDLDPETLVAPVDDASATFLAAVTVPPPDADLGDQVIDVLAGHVRVLVPVLHASYEALLDSRSEAGDGSLCRWLRFIADDVRDEWTRGEALLRSLVGEPAQVQRATARQAELDRLLLGCDRFPG